METLSMCRICLASDVRLCSISRNLQDMYEKLSEITFEREDGRPLVACYICLARLRNSYRLRTSCLRSDELLTQILNSEMSIPQEVSSTNPFKAVLVLNLCIEHVPQMGTECYVKKESTEIGQKSTKDIKIEAREETQVYDEDFLNIIKTEPDDVETENHEIAIENNWEPDGAGLTSQSAVKIGTSAVAKCHLTTQKNYTETTSSINRLEKIDANVAHPQAIEENATLLKHKNDKKELKQSTKKQLKCNLGMKQFWCDVCKRYFYSKTHLICHIRTHTSEKPFECQVCKESFTERGHLKVHMRTHTGEKHTCDTCKKIFTSTYFLKVHMRRHTGEKPYCCPVCKECFRSTKLLIKHACPHTGDKGYSCEICKKSFGNKTHLNSHMLTHTEIRPYSCSICSKCFNRNSHLKDHMRTHTGEKPYSCDICKKCFGTKTNLNCHVRTHTGEKPYSCVVCKKYFSRKAHLKDHMRTHDDKSCDVSLTTVN